MLLDNGDDYVQNQIHNLDKLFDAQGLSGLKSENSM